MNVPTPMNTSARDDRFNRGLERLLRSDPAGLDEIEPELQDVTIEMVKLANDAGWLGTVPGATTVIARPWWRNGRLMINSLAAMLAVGLITVMVTLGIRVVWDQSGGHFGSDPTSVPIVEPGPGVCNRAPRSDAEIASIVRSSEDEVTPFQSNGTRSNGLTEATQVTRDWNVCLLNNDWQRAMAYESAFFIWLLGQEEFPEGVTGLSDHEIARRVSERHAYITPLETVDGLNLTVYSADRFRYIDDTNQPLMLGVDVWLVPVDENGDWIEWFTVMTVEWDGSQWVIVSATRNGVPNSNYFRHDTLPVTTPVATLSP